MILWQLVKPKGSRGGRGYSLEIFEKLDFEAVVGARYLPTQ